MTTPRSDLEASSPSAIRPKRIANFDRPQGVIHQVAGLFAGIGGIELGLSRYGHETSLLCEIDDSAKKVLGARFPDIRLESDIRNLTRTSRDVSLITAGFPCQDLSQAGKTCGIAGARSGLVGEVFRLVEKQRTPWVLLENVPFMLQLGKGEAMNVITSAFEALGYRWAYRTIDARAFGLPQRRRRVYFLASREGDPRTVLFADEAGEVSETDFYKEDVACGFYWTEGIRGLGWAFDAVPTLKGGSTIGIPSSPAIVMSDGRVVTPDLRDAERLQGFKPDWTKPAEEVSKKGSRWKLIGNAVSVPAAAWIGRRMAHPGIPIDFQTSTLPNHRRWPSAAWNVDGTRNSVNASAWPIRKPYQSLSSFLSYPPQMLSLRATSGFLSRTEVAKLNFPDGFLKTLRKHRDRMAAESSNKSSSASPRPKAA